VCLAFCGDGSTSRADFHESLTMASVLKLPNVFVIENNQFAYSTPLRMQSNSETFAQKAVGYGIPGVTVDGNDLQEVHDAVSTAVERARAGRGPTLVENVTYRWKGHSKSDKNLYRTREEIAAWQERDPITRFEEAVRKAGSLTDEEITAARRAATDAVRAAIREANGAPAAPADRDLLLAAVYADAAADNDDAAVENAEVPA